MSWVVEPNVVGGWDVREQASSTRTSRHSSRDEAVAAARAAGDDVVVVGLRGEVLERFGKEPAEKAPQPAKTTRAATGRRPGMRLAQILTLTDQTDETGRLLLEDSAPKQAIRKVEKAGISMRTAEANFPDTPSRMGGQMNAAAYEALRRDTAEILNGFAWLARNHQAVAPQDTGAPRRLYAVSYLGVSLVHLLFHRAEDPVPPYGHLPSYIASIFKASRGIFSFSIAMENDLGPSKEMTAAEVVAYAEEKRQLVRPTTKRVCAAPTRLIERTLAVILGEREQADADKSGLADLLDFDALWEFYRLQDAFGELASRFRVMFERMAASGQFADPNKLFKAKLPTGETFGAHTERVLREVNDMQAQINRVLGRAENAKAIGLDELVRLL